MNFASNHLVFHDVRITEEKDNIIKIDFFLRFSLHFSGFQIVIEKNQHNKFTPTYLAHKNPQLSKQTECLLCNDPRTAYYCSVSHKDLTLLANKLFRLPSLRFRFLHILNDFKL